ncbi:MULTISPECIES: DMT family transporter [unclassified Bradyrhizobium]|uniref:DMT family transporter n=1 Tax=unclassified Bradyrhizobium TaxID=2631580 RepID=UPI0020125D2A|nr:MULTISPECIES: DMT family transporter [unclassified Bradyrhizobium]
MPLRPVATPPEPRATASIEADVGQVEAEAHPGPTTPVDRPLRGILLVLTSTIFLSSSDTMAKYLALRLPAVEIGWLRYLMFTLLMLPVVLAASPRQAMRTARPGMQVLRGLTLVGSSLLFISALRFLPIAEATTTSFVSPIFVTVLSIFVLGEVVGLRRWLATITGLVGVIIVVRPGTSAFHPAALLAITSALCWAVSLVTTRKIAGRDAPVTTMAYSAIVGFVLLSIMLPFVWMQPTAWELAIAAALGIAATSGHWLVVLAYRYGDASVLALFSYTQPIWATLLGYAVFGDVPDGWTFVGAAVIIASGLYTAHRERVRRANLTLRAMAAKA